MSLSLARIAAAPHQDALVHENLLPAQQDVDIVFLQISMASGACQQADATGQVMQLHICTGIGPWVKLGADRGSGQSLNNVHES